MPIWLRNATFKFIDEFHNNQNKEIAKSTGNNNQTTLISPDGKINTPEFLNASQQYKGKTSYK